MRYVCEVCGVLVCVVCEDVSIWGVCEMCDVCVCGFEYVSMGKVCVRCVCGL